MAEIVITIASKVAEYLVAPISQRAAYLFCFKQFIGDVEKAKEELQVKLAEIKKREEEADRTTREIMPSVKKWLDDVNVILKEVQELQKDLEGRGNKCCNVSVRYSLAKEMADKATKMMDLKQNSNFEPFSQLIQLPGISYFSSKDFLDFNSRKPTYNILLEEIKHAKNKTVGLYGMVGSGKTTLAKEVGREVDELKVFDKVIMVVISKTPNVLNIQQEIADQIGLELKETTQFSRAQRLSLGLKNKKILIILDDLWSKLSLEQIGIPLNGGCCVLLTTRLHNVCVSMDCESIIGLPLLIEEEAQDLFKMCANTTNVLMNDFDRIGKKIVDQCKGLPIAIVTVGSTLKGKSIQAWKSILRRLQHPPQLDIEDDLKTPYAILEVSYDNLSSPLAKSLFLLCSIFPEDHEIHMEDLIRFGKGTLKLGDNIYTMEDARHEILAAIDNLLDSCLLMHTDKQACVKLHDVVRDVALWIGKKIHQEVLVDSQAVSNMLVKNYQSLKDTKTLSLWNLDNNFRFSNQLHCLTLEILLLQPFGFIEDLGAIKALKVLALITNSFEWPFRWWHSNFCSISQSIISLSNLHTLCLRGKALGDISFLSELKGLEIIDLRGSIFDELPGGIVDMKMLKLLDMLGCDIVKSPLDVIGRCEQLEELYFWDKNSAIPEEFSLSSLKRYVIYDSTCCFAIFRPPFLEYFDSCDEALRALCIQGFKLSALNSSMKDLILKANYLWVENCRWDHEDINVEIKHLVVSRCQEKRFIIDDLDVNILQTQPVFSHLITLRLIEMNSLEQVLQDSYINCSLPMLQELRIQSCPKLRTCIFTNAKIMSLPKLRKLVIYSCSKVKWLFSYSLASHCPSLEEISISDCSEYGNPLLHQTQSLHGKKDYSYENENERVRVVNLELRILYLEDLSELEYIWKGPTQIVSLFRLEEVTLEQCPGLKHIFTLAIVTNLPELRTLIVEECEEWEGIFCEESLKILSSSIVCFPRLEIIRICDCHKVRRLFSYSLASHCPSLKQITIHDCSQLEGVVQANEGEVAAHHESLFPKLSDLDLRRLPKLREIYPGYEFILLFGTMEIQECPNISNIPLEHKAASNLEIKSEF